MCYEASEKPIIASIIDITENMLFRDQGNNFKKTYLARTNKH